MASATVARGSRTNQVFSRYRFCQDVLTKPRQFAALQGKVADYEELLKVLITKVGENDVKLIKTHLEKAGLFKGNPQEI